MNLHIQKSGKSNKGFYVALGVCLIAVGIAAWTTYDSVVNYATPMAETDSDTQQTNNTVSGIFADDSQAESSQPSSSGAASSTAVSSAAPANPSSQEPAKQTAAKVTYIYPVGKTVLQKYSEDPVYCSTTQDWRAHTGVDFVADAGETVKSVCSGTVKKVYTDDQYGKTVIVTNGTVDIWYCGLDEVKVQENDSVKQGAAIGTVGQVPIESQEQSHLHLAIQKDGSFVDPLSVLG